MVRLHLKKLCHGNIDIEPELACNGSYFRGEILLEAKIFHLPTNYILFVSGKSYLYLRI